MQKISLAILALMILAAPCLFAQGGGANLSGKVTDPQGAVVPGATITLTSPAMQGPKTAITDRDGKYVVMGLPPGTYELLVEQSGFQAHKLTGILLRTGASLEVDATLKVAGIASTVTVTAEAVSTPILDVANPELRFNISGEFITKLPTGSRQQWEQIWFLIPGSETGSSTENFDPVIHGGSARSNVYKLDGLDIGNAFTNQGWTTQFSTEAISDVAIKTAGIDASTPLGVGGYVNVVTKSGGNKFHGSGTFFMQPQSFNWTNVPGGTPADQVLFQPDVSVGGPIIKDRTWFFASYRRMFVDQGVPRSVTEVTNLKNNGFPVPDFKRLERSNRGMGKITHKLNNKNNLTFTYMNDHGWIFNSDARTYSDQLSTINYDSGGPMYQANWSSTFSPNILFNAMYGFRGIRNNTEGRGGLNPAIVVYSRATVSTGGNLTGQDVILYTGNRSGGAWWSAGNRNQHETTGDLTWVKSGLWGRHNFQAGYQWKPATKAYWDNLYPENDPWFIYQVKTVMPDASVKYLPFYRQYVTPSRIKGFNGTSTVIGSYVQDKWSPLRGLTINLGLRIDYQRNQDFNDIERFNMWAVGPRLGFAYSLTKRNRDVVRFSWARVNDLIYLQGAPSFGSATRGYRDEWDNNLDGTWEKVLVTPAPLPAQYGVTSFIDPNIKTPFMDEFHFGYTRELPGKVSLDVAYVYRDNKNPTGTRDTNIIYENGKFLGYKDPAYNSISVQTNLTNYHSVYKSLEMSVVRNIGAKWTVFANYSYQNNVRRGVWAYEEVNKYFHPDSWYDNNQLSRTHIIRMNGSYSLPFDFQASAIYSIQSGTTNGPVTTTLTAPDPAFGPTTLTLSNGRVVSNPLSSTSRLACPRTECYSRTPFLHMFNLRLGKQVRFGESQSIGVDLDLFNVFNKATPLGWLTTNKTSANWGLYSSSVQSPRAIELSFKYRF